MNIKNKKGFTLIELMGVILILGIILIIGIPTIMKYVNKGKNVYYNSLEKSIKTTGMEYLETYRTLLPRQIGHYTVVSIDELVANGYIDQVADENGQMCSGQVVVKKRKTDSYDYHSCLKCGDKYISNSEYCVYNEETGEFENNEYSNTYADSSDYKFEELTEELLVSKICERASCKINACNSVSCLPDNYSIDFTSDPVKIIAPQGSVLELPKLKVYHKELTGWEYNGKEIEGNPNKIDTDMLGTKLVTYYYHGVTKKITTNIIDTTNPSKTSIVAKYNSANGKAYKGNWYSGNIYLEFKATDYTKVGVAGSGINHYEYKVDTVSNDGTLNETYTEVSSWKKVKINGTYTDWLIASVNSNNDNGIISDGIYRITVRAIDNSGNIGETNEIKIWLDTNKPDCELETTGTIGNGNWYKSNVTVKYKSKSGTTSEIVYNPIQYHQNGISDSNNTSVTITAPLKDLMVFGTITDEAGNVRTCYAPGLNTDNTGDPYNSNNNIDLDPYVPTAPSTGPSTSKDLKIDITDGNGVNGRWYTGKEDNVDDYKTTPESGVWHINDTTIKMYGGTNLSGNIYYYKVGTPVTVNNNGRTNNGSTSSNINTPETSLSATETNNTMGTTYYMMICSVAGNCSSNANYVVKLDKTTPTVTITATDKVASGSWHTANTTLTFNGSTTTSGNLYNWAKTTVTNKNGRPSSGTRLVYPNNTIEITSNSPTVDGENYYVEVCTIAGRCSTNNGSYLLKLDKTKPSKPVISGGQGNNKWNNDSNAHSGFTISIPTQENVSTNVYYLDTNTNPTTKRRTYTVDSDTNGTTYYAKVCSAAGLCSDVSDGFVAKLDRVAPGCTWSGENANWTTSNVTVTATCDAKGGSSCTEANHTFPYTSGTTSTANLSYTFKDEAGNSSDSTCTKNGAKIYVDKEAPSAPTSGAIGKVSGASTTGSIQTAASGSSDPGRSNNITYKYKVTTTNSKPSVADSGFTTSKNFTRSCGTSYYAWAIAEDDLGQRSSVVSLGSTSDGANSYSEYSGCSQKCGAQGTKTRTNTCALVTTELSASCTVGTYSKDTNGAWGGCSQKCGAQGTQNYTVTRTYYSNQDNSYCSQQTGVVTNSRNCTVGTWYQDTNGSWGGCSQKCGATGTKYYYVTRTWYSNQDNSYCSKQTNVAANSQSCTVGTWTQDTNISGWSGCSKWCGTGLQSRTATRTWYSNQDNSYCSSSTITYDSRNCNTGGCVAQIGSTGYDTLQRAFDYVGNGGTVTLAANNSGAASVSDKNVTLNLNGKTQSGSVTKNGSGTLTITGGGSVTSTINCVNGGLSLYSSTSEVYVDGSNHWNCNLVVNDGTHQKIGSWGTLRLTVYGGTIKTLYSYGVHEIVNHPAAYYRIEYADTWGGKCNTNDEINQDRCRYYYNWWS